MSTPNSNTSPTAENPIPPTTPEPKRSSGVSPVVIVLIFGVLLGAVTYGIYTVGSSFSGGDKNSSIDQVVNANSSSTTGGYSRAEAYTKLFQNAFKAGSGLAASANISPESLGVPNPFGGSGMGADTNTPYAARQLSQEEIAAMQNGMGEPSRDELVAKELGDEPAAQPETNTQNEPIQSQKFVFIGKPSLFMGDNVITDLSVPQPDGSYQPDESGWNELATQQFSLAKLTRAELTQLASVDLDGAAIAESDAELLKKFVRLFYYGKRLNKTAALSVLLDKVHPSIKAAALSNPDLSTASDVTPTDDQAQADAEQNTQQDYNASLQQLQDQQAADQQAPSEVDAAQAAQEQAAQEAGVDNTTAELQYEKGRSAANSGNFDLALQYWKPLAQQGMGKAQTAIGRMYARGDGVPQNYSEAMAWFKMAAEKGDEKAMLNLGKMYLNGHGVKRDKNTAATYFSRALAAGNQEAKPLLKQALE